MGALSKSCTSRLSCAVVLALACGGDTRGEASTAAPSTDATSETGVADSDAEGGGDGPEEGDDGIHYDVGTMPDLVGDESCAKLDLLFVIDDSGSMALHQANLIANFPAFVEGMQTELADADSYHVGIVTSDAYGPNADGCTDLGHLVTQTGGPGSSEATCAPFATNERYMDGTEPDLAQKFGCVAQVGVHGSSHEAQVEAAYRATAPENNVEGACNASFIREDALLVVVIVTDEDDTMATEECPWCGSEGTVADWFETLVAHKQGIEENIVVLSIVGHQWQADCPAAKAENIIEMTEMFTYGSLGDVCAPDYADFFSDALSVIDTACDGFTPPG
jgi:hypothetical protein